MFRNVRDYLPVNAVEHPRKYEPLSYCLRPVGLWVQSIHCACAAYTE